MKRTFWLACKKGKGSERVEVIKFQIRAPGKRGKTVVVLDREEAQWLIDKLSEVLK